MNLYAYIEGSDIGNGGNQVCYIYMFDGGSWIQLHYRETTSPFTQISPAWIPIAVSPVDANAVYFGHTRVVGDRDISVLNFDWESTYSGSNCHADIHALAFQPNVPSPQLLAGHDGGVSIKTITGTLSQTNDWQWRNNGLAVKTIWSYGASDIDKSVVVIGSQDTGADIYRPVGGQHSWENVGGGDGYGAQVLNKKERHLVFLENTANIQRFDYIANTRTDENSYLPIDPIEAPNRAWKPKTFQVVEHPDLANPWVGFTELYERIKKVPVSPADANTPSNVWTLQSDVSKAPGLSPQWIRQLTEFAIAESDPNVIYATQGGLDNGPNGIFQVEPNLMRSTTGGNNGDYAVDRFVDITASLPNMNFGSLVKPIITGIAIDPADADRVWLSFTGYDPDVKVYWTEDGGATWMNADPDGSLANLPVNGIVYQSGTDDLLYIATDAGVYYKDNSMTCWAKYGDIPNVRTVELRINQCKGTLTAATFGRGVWEADLLPRTRPLAHTRSVSSGETWAGETYVHGQVRVLNGATLTITGTVHFPAGGRLIIDPGAMVVVDGGVLTNSCEAMWDGVQVHGNYFAQQTPSNQGVLRMRGQARIENALTGVLLAKGSNADPLGPIIKESTGGYINATDAKFLNNRYDVVFRPFENRQDGTTTVLSNRSSFVRCSFRTLGDLNDPWLYPKDHVAMVLNRGIRFHGCDFSNAILGSTYDLPFEQGTGIHSMNSSFIVGNDCNVILPYGAPCPPANTTSSAFTNLHRGILATTFDPSRTFSVSDATFTGTNYGIRMEGIQDAAIHRNAFEVPEPITPGIVGAVYGVYSDQCTGYSIQENAFLTTQPGGLNKKVGLVIKDSGPYYNTFYNNTFENLYTGTIIEGKNATSDETIGLEVKCNEYGLAEVNAFDVALTGNWVRVQGTQGTAIFNPFDQTEWKNPAGNRFSLLHDGTGYPEEDWYVEDLSTFVEYFHHAPTMGNRSRPDYRDPNYLLPNPQIVFWPPSRSLICPSRLESGGHVVKRLAAEEEHDEYGDSKDAYATTKDDGDTYSLLGYVSDPAHSSAQLRNALQSVAPKVSVDVWKAAFERDPAMNAWHITQALLSNSPLQGEVLQMVEYFALPESYANLVYSAQTGEVNILSLLQSAMAIHGGAKSEALADLGRMTWLDSLTIDPYLDSLLLIHGELPAWNSILVESGVLAAKGHFNALEVLAQNEALSGECPELYDLLKRYAQVEQNAGWDDTTSVDVGWLAQLAAQRDVLGSAQANAWLHALGTDLPEEIIILPGEGSKSMGQRANANAIVWDTGLTLEVFPNPSSGPVFAVVEVPEGVEEAELRVLDVHGRVLQVKRLNAGPSLVSLKTDGLAPGLYLAEVLLDGHGVAQTKMIIQR